MATTWTDDPITKDVLIKRVHILELQENVNRLRRAKSQPDYVFLNIPASEGIVDDIHIIQIKNVLGMLYPTISWNYDFTNITSEQAKCDHVAELRRQINIIDGVLVEYKSSALDWFFQLEDEDSKLTGYENDLIAFEYECPTSYDLTTLSTPIITGLTAGTHSTPLQYTITSVDPNMTSVLWEADGNPTITSGQLEGSTSNKISCMWGTPGTYNIRCKFIGNQTEFGNSNWSNVITTVITYAIAPLDKPNISSCNPSSGALINQNVIITCTVSANAVSYSWDIGSNATILSGHNTTQITAKWSQAGTYYIKVKAVGNGITYSDSAWSNSATYVVSASKPQLSQPSISCNDADLKVTTNQSVGFICTFDQNSQSITWSITGIYTITSGAISGSRNNNISIMWTMPGGEFVCCKTIAAGYEDSIFSNTIGLQVAGTQLPEPTGINGPAKGAIGTLEAYSCGLGAGDTTVLPYCSNVVWEFYNAAGQLLGTAEVGNVSSSLATYGTFRPDGPKGNLIGVTITNSNFGSNNPNLHVRCYFKGISGTSNDGPKSKYIITNFEGVVTLPAISAITSTFDTTPSVTTGTQCSFSVYGDSRASSVEWTITGTYTLHSGVLSGGSVNSTIIVSWNTAGSYQVQARNVGNGTTYLTGPWITENANVTTASVKLATPSITYGTSELAGFDSLYSSYYMYPNSPGVTFSLTSIINNASGYYWEFGQPVYIPSTGETVSATSTTSPSIKVSPTVAGFGFSCRCYAKGDGVTYINSDFSNWSGSIIIRHNTTLDTPSITVSANNVTINNAVTATITSDINRAESYLWSITQTGLTVVSGSLSGSLNKSISCKWSSAVSATIGVKALAKFYNASNYSTSANISVTNNPITLSSPMPSPTNPIIKTGENLVLSCTPIEHATSYEWIYSSGNPTLVSGGNGSTSITLKYSSAGSFTVQVRAIGNGTTYLSSNWSIQVTITVNQNATKLRTPTVSPIFLNSLGQNNMNAYINRNLTWHVTDSLPAGGTSIVWSYSGSPTLVSSGIWTGMANGEVVLKWATAGTYSVKYAFKGDDVNYLQSDFGPTRSITVLNTVKLDTPVLSNPADTLTYTNVTYTCTSVPNATKYQWNTSLANVPGENSKDLHETTTNSITLQWKTTGTKSMFVIAMNPSNLLYEESAFSNTDTIVINSTLPVLGPCTVTGPDSFATTSGMVNEYYASVVSNATSYSWTCTPDSSNISYSGISGTNFRGIKLGITAIGTYVLTAKAYATGYSQSPTNNPKTISVTTGAIKLPTPVFSGSYPAIWYLGDPTGGQFNFIPPTGADGMTINMPAGITYLITGSTYSAASSLGTQVTPGVSKSIRFKANGAGTFKIDFCYTSSNPGYSRSDYLSYNFICQGTQLANPTITPSATTIQPNINVTLTPSNIQYATSLTWVLSGAAYVLINSSLTGSKSALTVKYPSTGTSTITCKAIGNGGTYADSDVTTTVITIANGAQLSQPVITGPATAYYNENTVFSISPINYATSYTWGMQTHSSIVTSVMSGSLSGTTGTSITLKFATNSTDSYDAAVSCRAIGNGGSYVNSELTIFSFRTVKRATTLVTPSITVPTSSFSTMVGQSFTLKCESVSNASSYSWNITGSPTVTSGSLNSTDLAVKWSATGTYDVRVKAVGNGSTYLDSSYSAPRVATVTGIPQLATPVLTGDSGVNVNTKYTVTSTAIPGVTSYSWNITGSYTLDGSPPTPNILYLKWSTAGSYSISCMAKGNGTTNVDSAWSNTKTVTVSALPSIGTPVLSSAGGTYYLDGQQIPMFAVTPPTGAIGLYISGSPVGVTMAKGSASGTYITLGSGTSKFTLTQGTSTSFFFKGTSTAVFNFSISYEWNPATHTAGGSTTYTLSVMKRILATPAITQSGILKVGENVSGIISAIPNAGSYTWTYASDATLISGSASGSSSLNIIIRHTTAGSKGITCQAIPANTETHQSSTIGQVQYTIVSIPKLATPVISGPAAMTCGGTYTYTIAAIPNATNYVWAGIGFASINKDSSGLSCTVSCTTTGSKALQCYATANGYENSTIGAKEIPCNVYTFRAPTISVPSSGVKGTYYECVVSVRDSGSTVLWSVSGAYTLQSGSSLTTVTMYVKWNNAGTYSVSAKCVGNGTTLLDGPYCITKPIKIT